jgi:hypothetical protein
LEYDGIEVGLSKLCHLPRRHAQNKKALAANAEVLLGMHAKRLVGDAGFEPATPAV